MLRNAFELATSNIHLLTSLNKIYNFRENTPYLQSNIEAILKSDKNFEKAKLIAELNLSESFKMNLNEVIIVWCTFYFYFSFQKINSYLIKKIVIQLMLQGKFELIDELIDKSKSNLSHIMDCLNFLCDPKADLKKIAQ